MVSCGPLRCKARRSERPCDPPGSGGTLGDGRHLRQRRVERRRPRTSSAATPPAAARTADPTKSVSEPSSSKTMPPIPRPGSGRSRIDIAPSELPLEYSEDGAGRDQDRR